MQAALSSSLTPVGEEAKASAAAQRPKETKASKKADAADAAAAAATAANATTTSAPAKATKKASPRVRAPASKAPSKAEKRKASPARSNAAPAATAPQSTMAASMGSATTSATGPTTAAPDMATATSGPMGGAMGAMASPQELPPAQDNELRKACLQGVYRKLQSMLPNQDDTFIRRLATNVEIDVCRRVSTRNEYIAMLNHELHRVLQAELSNGGSRAPQAPFPGAPMGAGASAPMRASMHDTATSQQATSTQMTDRSSMSSTPRDATPRTATPPEGSFMSLLSGQNPSQSPYDKPQHQYGNAPETSAAMNNPYQPQSGRQSPFAPPTSSAAMYASSGQMPRRQALVPQSQDQQQQIRIRHSAWQPLLQLECKLNRSGYRSLPHSSSTSTRVL
ncbi:hypothetical protein PINS_up019933 [Pythium insidiosum]|nr:hypothetical protein PINS_up019933 [Pythium insidiosum]